MSGKLTTHVLDTANGCPAAGLTIELWRIHPSSDSAPPSSLVKTVTTNTDGRTNEPLLDSNSFAIGTYELRFAVGDYFRQQHPQLPTPLFLDWVPIRFGMADATSHYHVPLLCSPWAYSTYRGS
ncbi:MAG: hydroxyisourate hydrolase [Leptolyngbyaceae bacterium]|nr:hydroxyisourate hydrolase [Leptolyngbyaceae bacterium]